MKTSRKLPTSDPGFWPKWFAKLFFTFISVKVWGLVAGTIVSTHLLMVHLHNAPIIVGDNVVEFGINGAQWLAFNTTIWALIYGMKEIFRISEQSDYGEEVRLRENLENKLKIAGMISCESIDEREKNSFEPGYEYVGHNPDEPEKLKT